MPWVDEGDVEDILVYANSIQLGLSVGNHSEQFRVAIALPSLIHIRASPTTKIHKHKLNSEAKTMANTFDSANFVNKLFGTFGVSGLTFGVSGLSQKLTRNPAQTRPPTRKTKASCALTKRVRFCSFPLPGEPPSF
jgi:hypothetical protein